MGGARSPHRSIIELLTSCREFVRSIYQVIYGFFNLDFFSIEVLSFCLWRGATVLDIFSEYSFLVLKYVRRAPPI